MDNLRYMMAKIASEIIVGTHASRPGQLPGNFMSMRRSDRISALKNHENDKESASQYLRKRKKAERILRREGRRILGKDIEKYPLYFSVGSKSPFTSDKASLYDIDRELLKRSTYTIGDSFGLMRKGDEKRNTVISYDELNEIMLSGGLKNRAYNYIEGQMRAPYRIDGNRIVPV